jgi:hypothetical protein
MVAENRSHAAITQAARELANARWRRLLTREERLQALRPAHQALKVKRANNAKGVREDAHR